MALDHLPDPRGRWKIRRAIVDENSSTEVMVADDGPRPHHPADVGEPEEAIARLVIESQINFLAHLRKAAGMGVDRALRFARSAGGIEDECLAFGIHR